MGRTKGVKCPLCIQLKKRISELEKLNTELMFRKTAYTYISPTGNILDKNDKKISSKRMNEKVRCKASRTAPLHNKTTGKKYVEKKGSIIWKSKPSIKSMIEDFCSSKKTINHTIPVKYRCAFFLDALAKGKLPEALIKYYGNSAIKFQNGREALARKKWGLIGVEEIMDRYLAKLTDPEYVAPKTMENRLCFAIYSTHGYYSPLLQYGTLPLKRKNPDPIDTEPDVDIRLGAQKFINIYVPLEDKKNDYHTRKKVRDMVEKLVYVFGNSESIIDCGIRDPDIMVEEYALWLNHNEAYGLNVGVGSGWWTHFADEVLHLAQD